MLDLFSAWREVVHISEWTGLSLGAIAAIAALTYFVRIPLSTAIRAVVLIVAVYFALISGETFGARDKQRQWDAARGAAAKAQAARDAGIEKDLAAKYQPQLESLTKQALANQEKADALARQLAATGGKGDKAGAVCELGAFARRVRRK